MSPDRGTSPFTLIGHRGYSSDAPENTIAAFDLALATGFPGIELDVQLTSDDAPVVIHDESVNRTTDGDGRVRQMSLAEIRALDAGAWFPGGTDGAGRPGPGAYAGELVPTLHEVLERYRGRSHIYLELKSEEEELPAIVALALEKTGYVTARGDHALPEPGVTIISFMPRHLRRSSLMLGGVSHGWLTERFTSAEITFCQQIGFYSDPRLGGIYPHASAITKDAVDLAKQGGLAVRTWGVVGESDLRRAFETGASAAIVDWPERASRMLGL